MKKKTANERLIEKAAKATAEMMKSTQIRDCHFETNVNIGDAVETIAEALLENARALGTLANAVNDTNISAFSIGKKL